MGKIINTANTRIKKTATRTKFLIVSRGVDRDSRLKMTMTKMTTLMYMVRMMMTMVMAVTLTIMMAARRTVMMMMMMMMMMMVMMMVLRVAVVGTKATIAEKLYVKVDPNSKIKLKFMLESSRALLL